MTRVASRFAVVCLLLLALAACSRQSTTKPREYPAPRPDAALVTPLKSEDGPDLILTIDPITTDPCDHRFEARGHDPGVKLRHLEDWTRQRQRNARRYATLFHEYALTDAVTLPESARVRPPRR